MRITIKANEKGTFARFEKIILDYLEANASDALVEKINGGKKTLAGAWAFITREARKKALGGCACIEDAEVFGWAVHYFEEDELKEEKPAAGLSGATVTAKAIRDTNVKTEKKPAPKKEKPAPAFMQLSFADM